MNAMKNTPAYSLDHIYKVIDTELRDLVQNLQIEDIDELYSETLLKAYDSIHLTTLATDMKDWLKQLLNESIAERSVDDTWPIETSSPSPEEELSIAGFRKSFEEAIDTALVPEKAIHLYCDYKIRTDREEWRFNKRLKHAGLENLYNYHLQVEYRNGMDWRTLTEKNFQSSHVTLEQMKIYCQYREIIRSHYKVLRRKLEKIGYTGSIDHLFNQDRAIDNLKKLLQTGHPINSHACDRVRSHMDIDDDYYTK